MPSRAPRLSSSPPGGAFVGFVVTKRQHSSELSFNEVFDAKEEEPVPVALPPSAGLAQQAALQARAAGIAARIRIFAEPQTAFQSEVLQILLAQRAKDVHSIATVLKKEGLAAVVVEDPVRRSRRARAARVSVCLPGS